MNLQQKICYAERGKGFGPRPDKILFRVQNSFSGITAGHDTPVRPKSRTNDTRWCD